MNRITAVFSLLALVSVLSSALAAQCNSLTGPARNNSHRGTIGQVTANADITLRNLGVRCGASATGVPVEVWFNPTTATPGDANWTLVGTATVDYVADGVVDVPVNIDVNIANGTTFGICVVSTNLSISSGYTNGTVADTTDGNITISGSVGWGGEYANGSLPAVNASFTPRVWSGTVYYDLLTDPEIDVEYNGGSLGCAGMRTIDLGSVTAGAAQSLAMTVQNEGAAAALTLTTPFSVATTTGTYTAGPTAAYSGATSLAASASDTFNIDFTPDTGAFDFTVTIASTDTDEANYVIRVIGNAMGPQEIEILDPNASSVASGDTLTVYAATIGVSSTGVFTINNLGNLDLTFANTPVITESNVVNCTLNTINPTGPITGLSSSTFTVDVTPTASNFSFTFTIANNDADEGSFVINFSGIATTSAEAEIAVWDPNSANVANNGTFSESNTGTAAFNRTFTIRNEGGLALTLTGGTPVVVSGESNCSVGITQPTTPVAAATTWVPGSDTVVFAITPTAAGAFSFVVTIDSNDVDEPAFVFTFSGNTATPSGGGGGGGGGSDGGCSTGGTGHFSWLALLGLLSALVVFTRIRGSKA